VSTLGDPPYLFRDGGAHLVGRDDPTQFFTRLLLQCLQSFGSTVASEPTDGNPQELRSVAAAVMFDEFVE